MSSVNKKRPRAPENISFESCVICLNTFERSSIRGKLPCAHSSFCFVCILGWAEVTNKCPVCQSRFGSIESLGCYRKNYKILTRIEVEDRDQGGVVMANLNIPCKCCRSERDQDRLLLCDRCEEGAHVECLGMEEYPQLDEWYCDTCLELMPYHKQLKQWKNMKAAGRARRSLRIKRRLT